MVRSGEDGYFRYLRVNTIEWTGVDGEVWWKNAKGLNGLFYKKS